MAAVTLFYTTCNITQLVQRPIETNSSDRDAVIRYQMTANYKIRDEIHKYRSSYFGSGGNALIYGSNCNMAN